jgi:hypothetical protein
MTREELEKQREALLAEYQAAKQFNQPRKMDEIRKAGMAIKKRLENMCYTCKNNERDERYGEGCYCSQDCWDNYRPKKSSWDEARLKILERAKKAHTK